MMKRNRLTQSEHLQKGFFFNNEIKCTLMMLKLILRLFQENKSYGIKPICLHPLMSHYWTSLRQVWHNGLHERFSLLRESPYLGGYHV